MGCSRWGRAVGHAAVMLERGERLLLVLFALCLSGCGASTLRLAAGPEMDSGGHGGFEVMVGLGIGTPLDFMGRSHHFLQVHGDLGGGATGEASAGQFTALGGGDYMYLADPHFALRTGVLFAYRAIWESEGSALDFTGVGGHAALLPIVKMYDGGPMAMMINLGPDIRVMRYWGLGPKNGGPVFAVPIALELSVLAVGD